MSSDKKLIIAFLFPIILIIGILAIPSGSLRPQTMDITVKDLNDANKNTSDFKGKILFVDFMTTWCETCKQITINIRTILENGAISNSNDVIFISISIDPNHDSAQVLQKYIIDLNLSKFVNNGKWKFFRDTEYQSKLYQVFSVPYIFLVNKDLKIVDEHLGFLSQEEIINWINSI